MPYQNTKAPTTALILAAGFGTRLRPLTENTPKALIEVGGVPMLGRVIAMLEEAGIKDIIVNTHYLAPQINDFLRSYPKIKISHEPEILETGGGILNVMKNIANEDLLIVNSDVLYSPFHDSPFIKLLNAWDPTQMEFLLLAQDKTHTNHPGDLDVKSGVIDFDSKDKPYIFSGAYIVAPSFFAGYKVSKFRVPEVLMQNPGKKERYHAIVNHTPWFDIGTIQALAVANEFIANYATKAAQSNY
ncbi:MAG: nucleotidyltransferase family protein [Rickettsiales bacterium]